MKMTLLILLSVLFVQLQGSLVPPLHEQIGQKILVGFSGTTEDDLGVKKVLQDARLGHIGGVILFSHNIVSKEQITTLIKTLKACSKYPLIVSVDQEGGRVQRFRAKNGFTDYLSPYEVATTYTPEQAYVYYKAMAAELKSIGCTCTYGPVLDLHSHRVTGDLNPVIGALKRSFGSDAVTVVSYAQAFIKAHEELGIITALKHYPGHGLALADSHKGVVDITATHDLCERVPYREIVKEYGGMVMVAHLMLLDVDARYPTSLSEPVISGWLRREDEFTGVVVTDDLHMGAIQSAFGIEETTLQAVKAGVDILMFSNNPLANQSGTLESVDPSDLISFIANALADGRLSDTQITDSYTRIMTLKKKMSTEVASESLYVSKSS